MLLKSIFNVLLLLQFVHVIYTLDAIVHTPSGPIRGIVSTDPMTGQELNEYRGIRYGKPPVGNMRFRKPEPVDKWTSEYDASAFGYACPQTVVPFMDDGSKNQSEDCLFLNVYVPKSTTKKLSVMVWIHGGGFQNGNGHFYDGTRIAVDGDVIVVTLNYRLGIFGFLSLYHPTAVGNYGLWDQKLALQWVHDNIESFGGNPESVTIFGESAGGMSVSFQSLIPSNKGLFQRVIAQSGTAARIGLQIGKTQVKKILQRLPGRVNCAADNLNNFVECLRKATVEDLLKASEYYQDQPTDAVTIDVLYAPSVDGELLPRHPILALEDPNSPESEFFNSLDFIAGTNSQEGSMVYVSITPQIQEDRGFNVTKGIPYEFLCQGIAKPFVDMHFKGNAKIIDKMCKFYASSGSSDDQSNRAADILGDFLFTSFVAEMLDFHARSKSESTYQYQFSKANPMPFLPPPAWFKGTGHADELFFLFYREIDMNGNKMDTKFTDVDMLAVKRMITMWTAFAKTGVPSAGKESLPWLEYDLQRKMYLDIDEELAMKQNLKQETVRFWSEELPRTDLVKDFMIDVYDEL